MEDFQELEKKYTLASKLITPKDLMEEKVPLNLWDLPDISVFLEFLTTPGFCRNPIHKEPQEMVLKQFVKDGGLCKACPAYQNNTCYSVYPLEKAYLISFFEQKGVSYIAIPCGYTKEGASVLHPKIQDVDWNTVTTNIIGYDLKKDHDKLMKEIERLRKEGIQKIDQLQHVGVQKMNELQQAVTRVKEEVRNEAIESVKQALSDAHEKEIKRLNELREQELERVKEEKQKEIERLKKELEEVRKSVSPQRKRKHEDEKEEESSPQKKQKVERKEQDKRKGRCIPPNEKEFWDFVRMHDPVAIKVYPLASGGSVYRGHKLRCPNYPEKKTSCPFSAKAEYNASSRTYTYSAETDHNYSCLQKRLK